MLQLLPTVRRTALLAVLLLGVLLSVQAVERLEHDHPSGLHADDCALCCLPGLHHALPSNLTLVVPPRQSFRPASHAGQSPTVQPTWQAQARAPPATPQT